ncbi:MAG: helix-turn-helix domain-containing protein [Phycisphaerales bacterium]|nr:helix-turn-helix domain-containing protein [Phycisphaerales bacterium]
MPAEHDQATRQAGAWFASTIKQRRARLNLSLAQVAERVGCAKSYLSSMERAHKGPPSDELITGLEEALSFTPGELINCARWDQTPETIRCDLESLRERESSAIKLARLLATSASEGGSLDELYKSGELSRLIGAIDGTAPADSSKEQSVPGSAQQSVSLPREIPLVNRVAAGYPVEFTDLGYPAGIADEYIRSPDVDDPDAFAARVVGDSMEPDYREGDIVVFSPVKDIRDGMDCFVRLEPDHETTFKRIYFHTDEQGNEHIRIQPINNAYAPRTIPRDQVAGLFAGVSVIRPI